MTTSDLTTQLLEAAAFSEGRRNYLAAARIRALVMPPSPSRSIPHLPHTDFFVRCRYVPNPVQSHFHSGNFSAFHSSFQDRGQGRSTAIRYEASRFAHDSGAHVLVIYPKFDLVNYQYTLARDAFTGTGIPVKLNRSYSRLTFSESGGTVTFRSVTGLATSPSSVQGDDYQLILFDDCTAGSELLTALHNRLRPGAAPNRGLHYV